MKALIHTVVWVMELVLALAFIFLVILAILPFLLSTNATRPFLLSMLNKASDRSITIEEASLSWFGPQYIKGICIQDPVRHASLQCDEIATNATLWEILVGDHDIGHLQICSPYLLIQTEQAVPEEPPILSSVHDNFLPLEAAASLQNRSFFSSVAPSAMDFVGRTSTRSLQKAKNCHVQSILSAGPTLPLTDFCSLGANAVRMFSGEVNIMGGTVEIAGPHINTVFFRSVIGLAKIQKTEPQQADQTLGQQARENLEFRFQGDSEQKSAQGEIKGSFHCNGTLSPCTNNQATLSLQGGGSNLPVLGIDQLVSLIRPNMRGVLVAAFGSTLDFNTSASLNQNLGELNLELSSPQAKATINATTQDGHITLRNPAQCTMRLTAALADYVLSSHPYLNYLQLTASSQMMLTINSLSVPLEQHKIDWSALSMTADLRFMNVHFHAAAMPDSIKLTQFQILASTQQLRKELLIDSHMNMQYGTSTGALAASLQISSPLDQPSLTTCTISTEHFPVIFLDHLLSKNTPYTTFLGSMVDVRFGIEQSDDIPVATLYLSSEQLSIDGASAVLKPQIQLQKPVNIRFSPSPEWLQQYLPNSSISPVGLIVKSFTMNEARTSLTTEVDAASDSLKIENYVITRPHILLNIRDLDNINVDVQSDDLKGNILLSYDRAQKRLTSKKTCDLIATITPAAWSTFSTNLGKPTQLLEPVSINFEINPFSVPIKSGWSQTLSIDGNFELKTFILTRSDKPNSRFALQDVSCNWKLDQDKRQFFAHSEGKVTGVSQAWTPFQIECLLHRMTSSTKKTTRINDMVAKFAAEALDTTALDLWINSSHSLGPLLGTPLAIKFELLHKPSSDTFSLHARSDRLQLECALARDPKTLTLRSSRQPILCNWTVAPEGFALIADLWQQHYQEEIPLILVQQTPLSLRIDTLDLPLEEHTYTLQPNALATGLFSGNLSIERLPLIERQTQASFTFQHVDLQIQRHKPESPLLFQLKTAVEAAKPGLAQVQGSIAGLESHSAQKSMTDLHMKIDANFQNIPTALPDLAATLAGLKPKTLSTVFGSNLTGSMQADVQECSGPVSLQVNTPSTRLSFTGNLNRGVLSLREPLIAQVTLTEDFSRHLLEQANPLSLDIVTSEGPMTLTIEKEGVSLPLFPWNISSAIIPHARIDLGKITCHNQGNINDMLGLLRQKQFSRDNDLKLWFAPMDLSLKNGIMDCERTEILVANQLDIATWGEFDLNRDRVDAILGLTASALQVAFGINNLPSDYVLQLPMKGSIGNVKIDTGKATAKIAMLLAWQKSSSASGGFLGGTKGAIIGGVLGQLAQLPDSNSPTPPAKHPFPWENADATPEPKKKKRKTAIKPGDKPIKQLIKLFR